MARSLVLEGPRNLRLQADETPVIGPRDVHVRAVLSGISHGTELSLYRGTSGFTDQVFDRELRAFLPLDTPGSTYPAPLGYEFFEYDRERERAREFSPDVTPARVQRMAAV